MKIRLDKRRGHAGGKTGGDGGKSSYTLPLKGRKLYLDLQGYRSQRSLEEDLHTLGAIIERCFSKEVTCLITNKGSVGDYSSSRVEPKKDRDLYDPTSPATPSPFNVQIDSPQAHSPGTLSTGPKKPPMTRGQKIAEAARHKKCDGSTDIVEVAKKWRIKVVHIDVALKWMKKELAKLPESVRTSHPKLPAPKKPLKVKRLKSPCLKFEATNLHYRPVRQEFAEFPQLYLTSAPLSCPFEMSKRVQKVHTNESERAEGEERDPRPQEAVSELKESIESKTATPSVKNSRSMKALLTPSSEVVIGKIYTAGEVKRLAHEQRQIEQKKGYCELCNVKYENIDKHVVSEQHRKFVRNVENYAKLDMMIEASKVDHFMQNIINSNLQLLQQPVVAGSDDEVLLLSEESLRLTPQNNKCARGTASLRRSPRKKLHEASPAKVNTAPVSIVLSPQRPMPSPVKTPKKQLSCLAIRQSPRHTHISPEHMLFETPKKKQDKPGTKKQLPKDTGSPSEKMKHNLTNDSSTSVTKPVVVGSPVSVSTPHRTSQRLKSPARQNAKNDTPIISPKILETSGRPASPSTQSDITQAGQRISSRLNSPKATVSAKSHATRDGVKSPMKSKLHQSSVNSADISGLFSPRRSLQSQLQEAELVSKDVTGEVSMVTDSRASPGINNNTQTDSHIFSSQDPTLNSITFDTMQEEGKDVSQDCGDGDGKLEMIHVEKLDHNTVNEQSFDVRHSTPKPGSSLARCHSLQQNSSQNVGQNDKIEDAENQQSRRTRSHDKLKESRVHSSEMAVIKSSKFWDYVVEGRTKPGDSEEKDGEIEGHVSEVDNDSHSDKHVLTRLKSATTSQVGCPENEGSDTSGQPKALGRKLSEHNSDHNQENNKKAASTSRVVKAAKYWVYVDEPVSDSEASDSEKIQMNVESSKRRTRRSEYGNDDMCLRNAHNESAGKKEQDGQSAILLRRTKDDASDIDSVKRLGSQSGIVDRQLGQTKQALETKVVKESRFWQYVEDPSDDSSSSDENQSEILPNRTRNAQVQKKETSVNNLSSMRKSEVTADEKSNGKEDLHKTPVNVCKVTEAAVSKEKVTVASKTSKRTRGRGRFWDYVLESDSDVQKTDSEIDINLPRSGRAARRKSVSADETQCLDEKTTRQESSRAAHIADVTGTRGRSQSFPRTNRQASPHETDKSVGENSPGQSNDTSKERQPSKRFWHYVVMSENEEEDTDEIDANLTRTDRAARRASRSSVPAEQQEGSPVESRSRSAPRARIISPRSDRRRLDPHHLSRSRYKTAFSRDDASSEVDVSPCENVKAGATESSHRVDDSLDDSLIAMLLEEDMLLAGRRKTRGISGADEVSRERVLREILQKQEATFAQLKEESFTSSAQNSPKRKTKGPSDSNICSSPASSVRGIHGSEQSPKCTSQLSSVQDVRNTRRKTQEGDPRESSPASDVRLSRSRSRLPQDPDTAKPDNVCGEKKDDDNTSKSAKRSRKGSRFWVYVEEKDETEAAVEQDEQLSDQPRRLRDRRSLGQTTQSATSDESRSRSRSQNRTSHGSTRQSAVNQNKLAQQLHREEASSTDYHTSDTDHKNTEKRRRSTRSLADVVPHVYDIDGEKTLKTKQNNMSSVETQSHNSDRDLTGLPHRKPSTGAISDNGSRGKGSRFWTYVVETGDEDESDEEPEVVSLSRLRSRDQGREKHENRATAQSKNPQQITSMPVKQPDKVSPKTDANKVSRNGGIKGKNDLLSQRKTSDGTPDKNSFSPKRLRTRHDRRERRVVHIDTRPNAMHKHENGQVVKSSKSWTIVRYPLSCAENDDTKKVVKLRRRSRQESGTDDGDHSQGKRKASAGSAHSDADDEEENEVVINKKKSNRFWEYVPCTPEGEKQSTAEVGDADVRGRRRAAQAALQQLTSTEHASDAETRKSQDLNSGPSIRGLHEEQQKSTSLPSIDNVRHSDAETAAAHNTEPSKKSRRRKVYWTYVPVSPEDGEEMEVDMVDVNSARRRRSCNAVSSTDYSDSDAAKHSKRVNSEHLAKHKSSLSNRIPDSDIEKVTNAKKVSTQLNNSGSDTARSTQSKELPVPKGKKSSRFWKYVLYSPREQMPEEETEIEPGHPRRARLNVSYKEVEENVDEDSESVKSWNTQVSDEPVQKNRTTHPAGSVDTHAKSDQPKQSRQNSSQQSTKRVKNSKWQYVAFRNQVGGPSTDSEKPVDKHHQTDDLDTVNDAVQVKWRRGVRSDQLADSPQSSIDCGHGEKIIKQSRFWTIVKTSSDQPENCVPGSKLSEVPSQVQKGPADQISRNRTLTNLTNIQPDVKHGGRNRLRKRRVKLSQNWSLVRDTSMQKLLASEGEDENFEGFNQDDKNPASDLSFEEVSEVEVTEDSEVEWVIDGGKRVKRIIEIGSDALELDVDSGGSSETSWDEKLHEFVETKVAEKQDPSSKDGSSQSIRSPAFRDSLAFSPALSLFNVSMHDVEDLWTGPVKNDKTKWLKEGKIYKPSTPMLSNSVSRLNETPKSYLRSPSVTGSTALGSPAPVHSSTPVRPKPESKLCTPGRSLKSPNVTAAARHSNGTPVRTSHSVLKERVVNWVNDGKVKVDEEVSFKVSSPRKKRARTEEMHGTPVTPVSDDVSENQPTTVINLNALGMTPLTSNQQSNSSRKLLKSCSSSKKAYKLSYVPSSTQNICLSAGKNERVPVSRAACLSPLGPALMSPVASERQAAGSISQTPTSRVDQLKSPSGHLRTASPVKSALPQWIQGELRRSPRKLSLGRSPDSHSGSKPSSPLNRVGDSTVSTSKHQDFVRSPSTKRAHSDDNLNSSKRPRLGASAEYETSRSQSSGHHEHRTDHKHSKSKHQSASHDGDTMQKSPNTAHRTPQSSSTATSKSKSPHSHHTQSKHQLHTTTDSPQSPQTPTKKLRSPLVRSSPRKASSMLIKSTYEFDG